MKKRRVMALASLVLAVAACVGVFWYYHPTHFAYNDRFVLGSSRAQIEEKYGAFYSTNSDVCGKLSSGVYQIRDDTPELIMGYDNSLWYEVYFKDGIAVKVNLREGYLGG